MIMQTKLQPLNVLLTRKWRIFADSKFRTLHILQIICLNRRKGANGVLNL